MGDRGLKCVPVVADGVGMATVPTKLVDKVQFYETHLPSFTAHAAEIGLSGDEVTDLQAKATAARAAYAAQQKAMLDAQMATQAFNSALDALGSAGAACVKKIRATAESSGNPDVYTLSGIPPIAQRTPMAEPGLPSQLATQLDGNGSLILTWKCKNPKGSMGTVYQLSRKIGDGAFAYLGMSGEKRFVDTTIPAGATAIQYRLQAVRSTKVGKAAIFNVSFGSNGMRPPVSYGSTTAKALLAA